VVFAGLARISRISHARDPAARNLNFQQTEAAKQEFANRGDAISIAQDSEVREIRVNRCTLLQNWFAGGVDDVFKENGIALARCRIIFRSPLGAQDAPATRRDRSRRLGRVRIPSEIHESRLNITRLSEQL